MGHRDRLSVHLPRQNHIFQIAERHRALDDEILRVEARRDLLPACAGDIFHARDLTAERVDHGLQGHAAPDDAARGAHGKGGAAHLLVAGQLVHEIFFAIARALQHGGERDHAHAFQLAYREGLRLLHARKFDPPAIPVGGDGVRRRLHIVAHEEAIIRGDQAGAEEIALHLQRLIGMDDQGVGVFPLDIGGQRLGGLLRERLAGAADAGRRNRREAAAQKAAPANPEFLGHARALQAPG